MAKKSPEARIRELEQELTGYKVAHQTLLLGEKRLREILESSPIGVGIFRNHDQIITYANSRCTRLLGYDAVFELIGREIYHHWKDVEKFDAIREVFSRNGRVSQQESLLVDTAGQEFTGLVSWDAMHVDGDACTLFWIYDISPLKLAEAEIHALNENLERKIDERNRQTRDSQKRTQNFAEVSSDWFWEMDKELRYTFLSRRFEEITGFVIGDQLGKRRTELGIQSDFTDYQQTWDEHLADLNAQRSFKNFEYACTGKNGDKRILQISGMPVLNGSGIFTGYRGTGTDITARKALEARLKQSERMEAVGQLTGGLAHDFNNLLGILLGNAELLQDDIGENAAPKKRLEAIISAVKRGASLTDRMLAFSSRKTLAPVVSDVAKLVTDLREMLNTMLGEAFELQVSAETIDCAAKIDPHQFENALVNLSLNARDAMSGGGVLNIETTIVDIDDKTAMSHIDVLPGSFVRIEVSDTGCGMSSSVLAKAFEPFFTTKEVGKGTGLGLSMVYGFAKQSNGFVTIKSQTGQGTRVALHLPRSDKLATQRPARKTPSNATGGTERILVVEDDVKLREVVVTILRQNGYNVIWAETGEQGIFMIKSSPPFALVFSDIILPGGMNGLEFVEHARAMQPDIKVLYATGYSRRAELDSEPLIDGENLLSKPYHLDALLIRIRVLLDAAPATIAEDIKA